MDLSDDQSILVQVTSRYRQATSVDQDPRGHMASLDPI